MVKVINLTNFSVEEDSLVKLAKNILKEENVGRGSIDIILVGREDIKGMNKDYRNIDKETDVLSFSLREADKNFIDPLNEDKVGDVVICPDFVKENSNDFKKELKKVLIHGILHLLGYDHEKNIDEARIMERKTNEYLNG